MWKRQRRNHAPAFKATMAPAAVRTGLDRDNQTNLDCGTDRPGE